MFDDPYDNGTPKYKSARAIYDGLVELNSGEEISILGEMFPDISYDNQDYYYQVKGSELQDRFEKLSGYGEKMWLIDLAVLQIDEDEIHDTVYEALYNEDLAKRLGFRKLFVENLLHGDSSQYDAVADELYGELQELNCFNWYFMNAAVLRVMEKHGRSFCGGVYPPDYGNLCSALVNRVQNLHLQKETHLVADCRAFLTSYDDFILGLRMNQALYTEQERQFQAKVAKLEAAYAEQVKQLKAHAEQRGLSLDCPENPILIESLSTGIGEANEFFGPLVHERQNQE